MPLSDFFNEIKTEVEQRLDSLIPPADTHPLPIHDAMRYSVLAGGKRIRPALAIAASDAVGGDRRRVWPFASALELIHTYTLIHDDLPALDDDDLRRGKPTCHKKFGEANAILAGDALLTLAFEVMANRKLFDGVDTETLLDVTSSTASAIGSLGTIGGQVIDLAMEGKEPDIAALEYIHTHKTGKLIVAAISGGARLGGGSSEQTQALVSYGKNIGLAFQVADDILDIEGDEEELGKTIGADSNRDKLTYPALFGKEESKELAVRLTERAIESLDIFGEEANRLKEIARYIVERTR